MTDILNPSPAQRDVARRFPVGGLVRIVSVEGKGHGSPFIDTLARIEAASSRSYTSDSAYGSTFFDYGYGGTARYRITLDNGCHWNPSDLVLIPEAVVKAAARFPVGSKMRHAGEVYTVIDADDFDLNAGDPARYGCAAPAHGDGAWITCERNGEKFGKLASSCEPVKDDLPVTFTQAQVDAKIAEAIEVLIYTVARLVDALRAEDAG